MNTIILLVLFIILIIQSGNYDYLGHIVGLLFARLLVYILPISLDPDMIIFSFILSIGLLTMILYKNSNVFFGFITITSGVMFFQLYNNNAQTLVVNLLVGGIMAYLYTILLATYNITLYDPKKEEEKRVKENEELSQKEKDENPVKCGLFKNNILVRYV